jgi:hypothetical protein
VSSVLSGREVRTRRSVDPDSITYLDVAANAPAPPAATRPRIGLPRNSDALLCVALLSLAISLLVLVRSSFDIDSWLELTVGREIWQSGIPHHNLLTVAGHGAQWVDQQWLAQLASYAVYRLGGLGLLGVVNVGLMVAGVAGAVWGARRLGGDYKSIVLTFPLALALIIPAREVRTQAFAIPLFVALIYLLSSDSRRPSPRVYWCFPILILWANVHGTVTFAAGLVALRGITLAWERRAQLRRSWRSWRRPLALLTIPPLCVVATPYNIHIFAYYQSTLGNSALKAAVTEWQPITSDLVLAIPFAIVVGAALWSFIRAPTRTSLWEKLALVMLAAAAADALRGALLFALLALLLLPSALRVRTGARRARPLPARDRLNAILGLAVLAPLLLTATSTVLRPAGYFEQGTGTKRILAVVRQATRADPALRVMADMHFADWLLWKAPELQGKVVDDARFEILPTRRIHDLVRMASVTGDWKAAATGARLLVLDSQAEPRTVKAFLKEPGRRVLYRDHRAIVILRSAREAR